MSEEARAPEGQPGPRTERRAHPLVSIIVPVYNSAPYLRESLDSILGQTYAPTEIIVMDDASDDASAEIVAGYEDKRLRYVRQPHNVGQFPNVNAGIRRAAGDLIAVYHSDDVYDPQILEREVAFLQAHQEIGAVFAIDTFIDGQGREVGRLRLPGEFRGRRPLGYGDVLNGVLRYGNSFIRCPTSLVRRRVYESVGSYREDYDLRADLDMWLRIAQHAPIAILDEHLVAYRFGHDNVSARYEHLRTSSELSFAVIDRFVAEAGEGVIAPDALRAHESRRAGDHLTVAVNRYVRGDSRGSRESLRRVGTRRLAGGATGRRPRTVALFLVMQVVTRGPRSELLARAFYRRLYRRSDGGSI